MKRPDKKSLIEGLRRVFSPDSDYKRRRKTKDGSLFFPLPEVSLKQLRVAIIADKFTVGSYAPECVLLEVTPSDWETELEKFKPHLMFIESAWQGKDGLWSRKIDRYSPELDSLCKYCRTNNIPIVFWNKEDPVYTDAFMTAAGYADYVFTTDIDCIPVYKARLSHDRVYHLHFAAQPKLHNPIEKYDRLDKFCFAGAYYHKYKERSRIFDSFSDEFISGRGFDIYDRNFGSALPEHAFPQKYAPYILGRLDSSEIDKAYKGYCFGVNMNSISNSQTMFARRVFEMLASNTVTVGNYSRGLVNYFGDLTISTDSAETVRIKLDKYAGDTQSYRKYRLRGLRAALSDNLYEDRLSYICEKVFGSVMKEPLPCVTVYSDASSDEDIERVRRMFSAQTYENKALVFLNGKNKPDAAGYAAFFSPDDLYCENYLTDMMLTLRYYPDANGICKAVYYKKDGEKTVLHDGGTVYKNAPSLVMRRGIVKSELAESVPLEADTVIESGDIFSVDEFNYCCECRGECPDAADMVIADTGIPSDMIRKTAENAKKTETDKKTLRFSGEELARSQLPEKLNVNFTAENGKLKITSRLEDGHHEYIYVKRTMFKTSERLISGKLPVQFMGGGKLDLICVVLCFDMLGKKTGALYPHLNRYELLELPEGTHSCEIGFRPKGPGEAEIREVLIGAERASADRTVWLARSPLMVLAPGYPSYDDLYKYMFVHRRIKSYAAYGTLCDVMALGRGAENGFREYDGVNVVSGQADRLIAALRSGEVKQVFVHFLDPYIWGLIKPYLDRIELFIWSHGFDIQPWFRRKHNFTSPVEIENAKKQSEIRSEMWCDVFNSARKRDIKFVFVSEYLRSTVAQDYGVELTDKNSFIIHNCIDTDLFSYEKKDASQRFKVLAVKSFANRNYANDIAAAAIKELSNYPEFKEMTFDIYGAGALFDSDNAEIKQFENVRLHKTFLSPYEIAALHKTHGIFLAATRMDTQGVSRDEAMSSGLVPVTNNVAAVGEFVDGDCAVLAPGEDCKAMASGMLKIVRDPDLFMKMSSNAAARVRKQSAVGVTVPQELALIKK